MLKKVAVFSALVALLIVAVPANAQDDDFEISIGLKGGWMFLQDAPLSDSIENNWLVGGDLILWTDSGFGFGADVKFSMKDAEAADMDDFDMDIDFTQIPINLNAYYRMTEEGMEFTPYLGAGFSMVHTDIEVTNNGVATSQDEFAMGFNIIGGVQYENFFVEGQCIWAKAEFDDLAFIKEEVDEDMQVGGFNFAVGYRF